ncbi:dipeptide/oligopeptide/nickel ABC transporter permease/ATP-binding protein [Planomonospora corallina]|uniref:Dipeptide/oligopeptide/nickel ABC transporter permease/ATP-binding protein n=1 Tax=Planomonospora corallina TaxID=1806052 RepID=A0ABV8I7C2_9ACTN
MRRRPGWGLALAAGWLALVLAAALTADLLPLPRYDETLAGPPQSGPGPEHPFGTDALGRDLLSRVVHGARVSLGVGVGAVALGLLIGAPLGVLAGYRRRLTDTLIMGANDIALAFPSLVFALAVVAFTGASLVNVLVVLGLLGVPAWVRLLRGTTMVFAEREFVTAARALGARDRSVLWREVVPNVALPAASYAFIGMAVAIVAEGGLAFLGLSVQAPTPTWGGLINEGRPVLETAPHVVLFPSLVMFLTVLSANLVGDRLRALTDVRPSGLTPERPRRARRGRRGRRDAGGPKGAALPPETADPEGTPLPPEAGPHRMDPGALLQVAGLRTYLPTPRGTVRAVDGVSFTLRRGRTLAVVGESGSGKSMLIRSILGLVPGGGASRAGRVHLDGNDITGLDGEEMRRILGTRFGAVFQDPMTALNPVRRIGVQVCEPLRVHLGMGRRAAWARGTELLASVGVPEPARVMRRYPHQLSGGMRQRVTIAMALACGPDVLFADEPTTALDVTVQDQVLRLIRRLREDNDMAVVLVSHDLSVVAEHADEVIVMYAGKVVERGPATALFERTRMPYTEALLAAVPKLTDPAHHPLRVIAGRPPDLADPPPGCSFQPRCPYARPRCAAGEPPLLAAETPGHLYACWYPRGTEAQAPETAGTTGTTEGADSRGR